MDIFKIAQNINDKVLPPSVDLLSITDVDDDGQSLTVGQILVRTHFHIFKDEDRLKIANHDGRTIAHEIANQACMMVDDVTEVLNDPTILALQDKRGDSVAHYLAYHYYWLEQMTQEIMMIKNNKGESVAHWMALTGEYEIDDYNLLSLQDLDGYSVAHIMVEMGYPIRDGRLLTITDKDGVSVADLYHQLSVQRGQGIWTHTSHGASHRAYVYGEE